MRCSLEFMHIGLPAVVHSQWDEAQTQCTLRLFADYRHVLAFLAELSNREEAQNLARCVMGAERFITPLCALPADIGEEGMYRIEGVAALSLTNFLVHLHTQGQKAVRVVEAPDLMGFWEPPAWRVPSEGMILWFHPDDGYRAVIAHARDQAADAIQGMSWLESQRKESLCAKINRWNAPRISPRPAQEIKGVCAEVLCHGSIARKIRGAIQTKQSVLLN